MKAQIIEQVELFSEAELESLEFVPEELEAIEEERVPDLESIAFEDIAEDLEMVSEPDIPFFVDRRFLKDPSAKKLISALKDVYGMLEKLRKYKQTQMPQYRQLLKLHKRLVGLYEKKMIPYIGDPRFRRAMLNRRSTERVRRN